MVNRIYVEKRPAFAHEANALLRDLRSFLRLDKLTGVRVINRYDIENIAPEHLSGAVDTIFSEKQLDDVYTALPAYSGALFASEYLPGQFDQRADSAAQCVQLAYCCERPLVRTAKLYVLEGALTNEDIAKVKKYIINPVECREASLEKAETLKLSYAVPERVMALDGFIVMDAPSLEKLRASLGLAMDAADMLFCQKYFQSERRDPTLTEIRMIDTYWSDHCRHTTFLTHLEDAVFEDAAVQAAYERYLSLRKELNVTKPVTLMNLATIGAKALQKRGLLRDLDESDEINACTVKITVNGEDWLLLFKNETHNHPTEIEPFGGAATCIGGAIRDPLSGRAYVYQAMRVTGAADPRKPIDQTIPGKLPQRKLVQTAAAGYSAYGNQIGLATGIVDELYNDGYAAKRMEIGAVVGAAPASAVRREEPAPGDIVVLLGGRTGRDGCGGATGSSKSHTRASLETCGAEVQKGNAPEERKLQRLLRDKRVSLLIKRCNDFGAGGVSVAIGELADGLSIDLNAVPKKYEGLDGTELAISESQERMAVVLAPEDADAFLALASEENLEATRVAVVTEQKRLVMTWNGETIVNVSREFLNSNGASRSARALVTKGVPQTRGTFDKNLSAMAGDLNVCGKRGLAERFDSTIGAGTVLMPFGGARQRTPIQAMVAKIPVLQGETDACSAMAYGCNPGLTESSPYHGAYCAVLESVAKLVAAGAGYKSAHLTFQEYFERMTSDESWGKPLSALLGALDAQLDLGLAAIGGKDSMSGSFEKLHVPPTLCSFAVNLCDAKTIISPEFKRAGDSVYLLAPKAGANGLPDAHSALACFDMLDKAIKGGHVRAAYAVSYGGVAEALLKMCMGNRLGFAAEKAADTSRWYDYAYGAFVIEADEPLGERIGTVTSEYSLLGEDMAALEQIYEGALEDVFPLNAAHPTDDVPQISYDKRSKACPAAHFARPRVLIPVFPGTNCELDAARAFERAGAMTQVFVVNNLSASNVAQAAQEFARAVSNSQIVFIPGGFSGGDEPDGSGKFIVSFFRNPDITNQVRALLQTRDGLMGGICNGFQALLKLGLLPYGDITPPRQDAPTLSYNLIGRHQSRLVRTRVCSVLSPWLAQRKVGDVLVAPVSHGEGRFIANDQELSKLIANGQIFSQYVDERGVARMDVSVNPNGSVCAVEGITSPDGRVIGKMAHSERCGENLYKNVPGDSQSTLFTSAVAYYR